MEVNDLLGVVAPLSWAELDGRWVVFQRANGVVCELDELSGLVLSLLEAAAATRIDLVMQVSAALAADGIAADACSVDSAIGALVATGLVERVHGTSQPCA